MTTLYGRGEQLARAGAWLDTLAGGVGGVLAITGEAGIGKSTLAREISAEATRRGVRVAWGRCWEVGGAPPLWPWVEIFRALDLDDELLTRASGDLGAQGRFRVLDAAARAVLDRGGAGAVLLVLDDLHAADVLSLDLLLLLSRTLRPHRVGVIAAYRDAEVRAAPELVERLSAVRREGEALALCRLEASDVAAWVGDACPELDAPARQVLYERSEGSPLFVRELVRVGDASGAAGAGLAALLDARLGRLSPAARALLDAAAIFGREFTAADAGRLAGLADAEADRCTREAFDAGIVEARSDHLTFSHVLVRDRVVDAMAPLRRRALHLEAGALLLERRETHWAVHHLLEGGGGDPEVTGRVSLEAARESLARLAFEDACDLAQRALETLGARLDPERRIELSLARAEALTLAGQSDAGRREALATAELARRQGSALQLAHAALVYGQELASATVDPVMVSLLEEALGGLDPAPSPLRARVLARLASALTPPADDAGAARVLAMAREARAMVATFEDPRERLRVLEFAGSAMGYLVGMEERAAIATELIELARVLDRRALLARLLGWCVAGFLERGRRAEAMEHLSLLEETLEVLPQAHYQWRLPAVQACVAAFDGRLEEAERYSEELHAQALALGAPTALAAWALQRISLAQCTGDPARLTSVGDEVLAIVSRAVPLAPFRAWVLAVLGRGDEARALLGAVDSHVGSFPWLIAACDAAVILGDAELAAPLYDGLGHHHPRQRFFWGPAGASVLGPTARTLGDLALLLGRFDEAIERYGEAVAECEVLGAVPLLALARRGLEEAERRRGAPADVAPAVAPAPAPSPAPERSLTLTREGDLWALCSGPGSTVRLKHGKGAVYLSTLLGAPGRRIHVLELVGAEEGPSDAGAVLDRAAKEAYRARLEALVEEAEEAEGFGDAERASRAREEIDRLAEELARAVGLGGRDRRAASNVERARVNVQRRLKDVVARIAAADASLGKHLGRALTTGTFCSYEPE